MSVTLEYKSVLFVRCGNNQYLSSYGGDYCSKKYKRSFVVTYGGVWQSVHMAGVWSQSDGRFCVDAFGRNFASVAVKMFSHLIYFR
jgi:hypothetical protein